MHNTTCLSLPTSLPNCGCPQVHNLGAVKQQLWGLELEGPCSPGDAVQSGAVCSPHSGVQQVSSRAGVEG